MAYVRSWLLQSSSVTCCDLTSCGRLAGQRDRDGERNKNGCEKWWETGAVSRVCGAVCRMRHCCNRLCKHVDYLSAPTHTTFNYNFIIISCVIACVCYIGHCFWVGGLGLFSTLFLAHSLAHFSHLSLFESRHIPRSYESPKKIVPHLLARKMIGFIEHSMVRHSFTLWGKLSVWKPAIYWQWLEGKNTWSESEAEKSCFHHISLKYLISDILNKWRKYPIPANKFQPLG